MSEIALRDYIEKLIHHEREQRELQFKEAERAINLAKETIDHRLNSMNELREQISKERGTFISREIFDRACAAIDDRVRQVERFKANLEGRLWIIGGILLVIQVAALFWLKK